MALELALRALRRTLKQLHKTYHVHLRDAVDHHFDYDKTFRVFSASDLTRKRVVRILNNFYERLLEPTVLTTGRRLESQPPLEQASSLHELPGDEPYIATSRFSVWSTPTRTPISPCQPKDFGIDFIEDDKRKGRQQSLFGLFQDGILGFESQVHVNTTLSPSSEPSPAVVEIPSIESPRIESSKVKESTEEHEARTSTPSHTSLQSHHRVTAPMDELRFSYEPIKVVANSKALRSTLIKISEVSAATSPKQDEPAAFSTASQLSPSETSRLEFAGHIFSRPGRPKPTRSQSERPTLPSPPPPPPPKDSPQVRNHTPFSLPIMDPLRANPCFPLNLPTRSILSSLSTSSVPVLMKPPARRISQGSQQTQQRYVEIPTRPKTIPQSRATPRRKITLPTIQSETFFLASSPTDESTPPIQVAVANSKSIRAPLTKVSANASQSARSISNIQRPNFDRRPTFPSMKPLPSLPRITPTEPKSEKLPCRSKFCVHSPTFI